ncbi:MAG: hypothetical protein U5Q16_03840 [Gammaproteobacteria bacterium]|nr:hypothetical protein [Gammaproteobacteria bacterium]
MVLFALLAMLRVLGARHVAPRWRGAAAAALAVFVAAVLLWQSTSLLKLYPVAVNVGLLLFALYTLRYPPSAIERLVRGLNLSVSAAGVGYMRNVTWLWCAFFVVNGSIAAYTALATDTATWAVYNGAVSYAAAGLLFAVEFVVRGFYRRRVARRADQAPSCP